MDKSNTDIRTVASTCGVSVQAVYGWLRDEIKDMKNKHLFELAELTGFEAKWIATGEGPMQFDRSIRHAEQVLAAMEPAARYTAVRLIDTLAEPQQSKVA